MILPPLRTLNDGFSIPQLGLGCYETPAQETAAIIRTAVEAGYRLIDTAAAYGNEEGVGEGVRTAGIDRDELFVTTKLWNASQGYDRSLRACEKSLGRLGLERIDLYLIHWPMPERDLYLETWRAFIRLREEGRVRSIGVSNFTALHLQRLMDETGVVPAVNQIELHPRFQQRELRAFHAEHGIATESWSPLDMGRLLDHPTLVALARKHGKSVAQVIIRWHIESGLIVIPKSATPSRIRGNIEVFDFSLDAGDMAQIAAIDSPDGRGGPDPLVPH